MAASLFGVIVLFAFAGLALALVPLGPRMVQLASTEIRTVLERTSEDTARATETVEETTSQAATESSGTVRATDERSDNTTQNSTAGEPGQGAGESESPEGQSSAEAGAGDAEPAKTSGSVTDGNEDASKSEAEGNADGSPSATEDEKDRLETKPEDKSQTNEPTNERTEEQEGAEAPEKQEEPAPPVPANKTMSLSVPRLAQVQGDTVLNSDSPEAMDRAAIKLPSTGFPWQEGANTYIAGHRIGWAGTQSRYQFYALPAMRNGDAVYLTDANGTTYEYRVTEKFAVKPSENWVTEPVAGRDMITLQTCTDSVDPRTWWDITPKLMQAGPNSGRLVVRADKVATYPA